MRLPVRHAWLAITLAVAVPTRSSALEDVLTARGLALSGMMTASATGGLAPLINPAAMALARQYAIEGAYLFKAQDVSSSTYLSVVDSVTSRLAAGVYYQFVHGQPKFNQSTGPANALREGHETGLSLALPLGDYFAIGLTSKYLTATTHAAGPEANKPILLDSTTSGAAASGFTTDAGLLVRIGQSFNVGLVGRNLVPLRSIEAPLGVSLGLAFLGGRSLVLSADGRIDIDRFHAPSTLQPDGSRKLGEGLVTFRVGGAAEYLIAGMIPVRVGAVHDTGQPGTYVSAGAGFIAKSFGIDLGFRQKVNGGNEQMLTAGVRVFLE